jgi:hypothetical protein
LQHRRRPCHRNARPSCGRSSAPGCRR